MPYTTLAKPLGSPVSYRLSEGIKRYTLRDVGFLETKQGNFQYIRPLDPTPQMKTGLQLKITIAKDFSGLKMSVVGQNGMKAVDIFKDDSDKGKMIQEKFQFYMNGLIQRQCLDIVE